VSELVNLKVKDIDIESLILTICSSKGKKTDSIISGRLVYQLKELIGSPIFHHYEGRRYSCKQKYCSHCRQKYKYLKNSNTKKRNLYVVTKKNRNYSKEMIEKIDLPESAEIYSGAWEL
jgi:hypothetical protein